MIAGLGVGDVVMNLLSHCRSSCHCRLNHPLSCKQICTLIQQCTKHNGDFNNCPTHKKIYPFEFECKTWISLKSGDYYRPEAQPGNKPVRLPGWASSTLPGRAKDEYYSHPWPSPEQKSLLGQFRARAGSNHYQLVRPVKL